MKSIRILVIVNFLILCKCSVDKDKINIYESFPQVNNLKGEIINQPLNIVNPSQIVILKDAFIILDQKSDYFFHSFDLDSFSYRNSFIRKGNGPNEEVAINNIIPQKENKFYYQILTGVKLFEYLPKSNSLKEIKRFKSNIDDLLVFFPLDSNIFGWSRKSKKINREFLGYNLKDNSLFDFGAEFPNVEQRNLTIEEKCKIFQKKRVTVKPDGTKFSCVYMNFPILRIYNSIDGKLLQEAHFKNDQVFPEAFLNKNSTKDQRMETTCNYWYTYSTNNYVYGLYSGKKLKEVFNENLNDPAYSNDFSNEIHVWDWNGNPIKRILLDRKIYFFAVTGDDKNIVASSYDSYTLIKFKL